MILCVVVRGVGYYLFECIVFNVEFEKILDIFDEWIKSWFGIECCYFVVEDEIILDLVIKVV